MKARPILIEFNSEVLYYPGLDHQVLDAFSSVLHASATQNCVPINDEIPRIESSSTTVKQSAEREGGAKYLLSKYFFLEH